MFLPDPQAAYRRASRAAAVLLLSMASVSAALFLQDVMGVLPCHLCLIQRWPHYIGILLAAGALGTAHKGRWPATGFLIAAAAVYHAGAALALYHSGVEMHWWAGPTGCTGASLPSPGSAEALFKTLKGAPPAVACDQVSFQLLGLSLANWNLALCIVLGILAWDGVRRRNSAIPAVAA